MKRFGALLIALFFSSVTASVFADAAKIGVVDLQKIMQTSNQMKTIQQKLENPLAQSLLKGEFKSGETIIVSYEDGLQFKVK